MLADLNLITRVREGGGPGPSARGKKPKAKHRKKVHPRGQARKNQYHEEKGWKKSGGLSRYA